MIKVKNILESEIIVTGKLVAPAEVIEVNADKKCQEIINLQKHKYIEIMEG